MEKPQIRPQWIPFTLFSVQSLVIILACNALLSELLTALLNKPWNNWHLTFLTVWGLGTNTALENGKHHYFYVVFTEIMFLGNSHICTTHGNNTVHFALGGVIRFGPKITGNVFTCLSWILPLQSRSWNLETGLWTVNYWEAAINTITVPYSFS